VGEWRTCGPHLIFHSNDVPMAGGMTLILCFGCVLTGALRIKVALIPGIIGLLALVGGTSAGSNIAFGLSLNLLLAVSSRTQKKEVRLISISALALIVSFIVFGSTGQLKQVIFPGKDEKSIKTATGRTGFWMDCLEMVAENPVFGSGFPTAEKE